MAQNQPISLEQFMATVKPWMLDANGRFKGPDTGIAYDAEGMTPEQYYAFMNEMVPDPNARDGADAGQRRRGEPNIAWKPGPIDTKAGFLGNWGPGLAMIAAPFAAGAMGLGAVETAGSSGLGFSPTAAGFSPAADSLAASNAFAASTGVNASTAAALTEMGITPESWAAMDAADQAALSEIATSGEAAATGGSATKAALYGAEGYGPAASPAEVAAAQAAAKSGMPMSELLKTYGPSVAKLAVAAVVSKAANDGGATGGGSSSNIDNLVSHALGNTQSMENDYNTLFKPWAIDQVGKATARGDAGYDSLIGLASAPNKNLSNFQSYVDRIGSQGYRDQQRGLAMGEVQQQADTGLASARRAAMARGVDPGKFALQANANSINTAAAKTKAASDAEAGAWDQFGKASQTASGMQVQDSQNRANLVTGANNLGTQGLNAGTKLATVDGAYRGGLTSGYNSTLGTVTGANSAANNQSNYEREHGLSGVVNAGLATAATKWLTDKGGSAIDNLFSS